MGLQSIHIKNYRCIRDYKIKIKQLNVLLGENGSGKTNILSAILYFYDNMISQRPSPDVFDENNTMNDHMQITLTYDLSELLIRSRTNRKKGKDKYQAYYKMIEKMEKQEGNGRISLTLSQVKGGKITWNHDIEKRKALFHMYPLYHLDAREINLVDWEALWGEIGDLLKPSAAERDDLEKEIKEAIRKTGPQLSNRIDLLDVFFQQLQVRPIEFTVSEFSANMAKIFFGGQNFSYAEHKLDSFSNGTNSYNYISLLLYVLSAMGTTKMKEPVILMDEPEISLHFHMIDELVDVIFSCLDNITVLVATHSSRFVRNVLVKENRNCTLYQVYKRGEYSYLCLLSMFSEQEQREKYFMTEHHANAFFAKVLVLVEGETELELFQNPYLRILFPVLKEVEVIKGMSDKVVYRIVDTSTRHYNVPMMTLLDMDKILEWNKQSNQMTWKTEYPFVSERENYYYGQMRNSTILLRRRIDAMCTKCRFSYRLPFYACDDSNYEELTQVIQRYYKNYNIFPVKTTIEGMLVNKCTYAMVAKYLIEVYNRKDVLEVFGILHNTLDRVNYLRLLFNGKSDFLLKTKRIMEYNVNVKAEIKKSLGQAIRKTDWLSGWICFYFSQKIGVEFNEMTEVKLLRYCESAERKRELLRQFYVDFSELGDFLNLVIQLHKSN